MTSEQEDHHYTKPYKEPTRAALSWIYDQQNLLLTKSECKLQRQTFLKDDRNSGKKKTDDRNFWSPTIHISTFGALHWSIIACHASTLLHYQFHRHAFILLGISHNIQKATVWFVIQNYSRAWLSKKHKAFRTDKPALQSQAY